MDEFKRTDVAHLRGGWAAIFRKMLAILSSRTK